MPFDRQELQSLRVEGLVVDVQLLDGQAKGIMKNEDFHWKFILVKSEVF
jgi:hypothetical protein